MSGAVSGQSSCDEIAGLFTADASIFRHDYATGINLHLPVSGLVVRTDGK